MNHGKTRLLLRWVALVGSFVFLAACGSAPAPIETFVPVIQAAPTYDPFRVTDPSTVVLAAGKPQLVEFFAYW